MSPVFVGIVETEEGEMLRIYEFDRYKETTWQVDLLLKNSSDILWIHTKVNMKFFYSFSCVS